MVHCLYYLQVAPRHLDMVGFQELQSNSATCLLYYLHTKIRYAWLLKHLSVTLSTDVISHTKTFKESSDSVWSIASGIDNDKWVWCCCILLPFLSLPSYHVKLLVTHSQFLSKMKQKHSFHTAIAPYFEKQTRYVHILGTNLSCFTKCRSKRHL